MVEALREELDSLILKSLPHHPCELDRILENSFNSSPVQMHTILLRTQQLGAFSEQGPKGFPYSRNPSFVAAQKPGCTGKKGCYRLKDHLSCSQLHQVHIAQQKHYRGSRGPLLQQTLAKMLKNMSNIQS